MLIAPNQHAHARRMHEYSHVVSSKSEKAAPMLEFVRPNRFLIEHSCENMCELDVNCEQLVQDGTLYFLPRWCICSTHMRPFDESLVTISAFSLVPKLQGVSVGYEQFLPSRWLNLPNWWSILCRCTIIGCANVDHAGVSVSMSHYLKPGNHEREVYDTSIESGLRVSLTAMQPTLRIVRRLSSVCMAYCSGSVSFERSQDSDSPLLMSYEWCVGMDYDPRGHVENVHRNDAVLPGKCSLHVPRLSLQALVLPHAGVLMSTRVPLTSSYSLYCRSLFGLRQYEALSTHPMFYDDCTSRTDWGIRWHPWTHSIHGVGVGVRVESTYDEGMRISMVLEYEWDHRCVWSVPIRLASTRDTNRLATISVALTSLCVIGLSAPSVIRRVWRRLFRGTHPTNNSDVPRSEALLFDTVLKNAEQEQLAMLSHAVYSRERELRKHNGVVIVRARYGFGLELQEMRVNGAEDIVWPIERGRHLELNVHVFGESDVCAYYDCSAPVQFWVDNVSGLQLVARPKSKFLGFFNVLRCPSIRSFLKRAALKSLSPPMTLEIIYQKGADITTRKRAVFHDIDNVELKFAE